MEIMDDPFPEKPGQREERVTEVKNRIDEMEAVPPEFREALKSRAGQFIDSKVVHGHGLFYGGQLGWTDWVIKNDDLNLLVQLSPTAVAIATFFTVAGSSPIVLAVGLVFSALALINKFNTKAVTLEDSDYTVLMTLKQLGPSSAGELGTALNGLSIYSADPWTEARALAALTKLKQVRQRDGSITTLVGEASDGRWSVSGI